MTAEPVAADLMTSDFSVKTISNGEVPAVSGEVIVACDNNGDPRYVVYRTGPGPAVLIPDTTTASEITATPQLASMVYADLPLLVTRASEIIGIITPQALAAFLAHGTTRAWPDGIDDTRLFGDPEPVSGPIVIHCRCGHANQYEYYIPGDPVPCAAGHPLVPEWSR